LFHRSEIAVCFSVSLVQNAGQQLARQQRHSPTLRLSFVPCEIPIVVAAYRICRLVLSISTGAGGIGGAAAGADFSLIFSFAFAFAFALRFTTGFPTGDCF
jgi:hypothetical protein